MRVQLSFFTTNWQFPDQRPESILLKILEKEKIEHIDRVTSLDFKDDTTKILNSLAKCHDELCKSSDNVVFYISVTKEQPPIVVKSESTPSMNNWVQFKESHLNR